MFKRDILVKKKSSLVFVTRNIIIFYNILNYDINNFK